MHQLNWKLEIPRAKLHSNPSNNKSREESKSRKVNRLDLLSNWNKMKVISLSALLTCSILVLVLITYQQCLGLKKDRVKLWKNASEKDINRNNSESASLECPCLPRNACPRLYGKSAADVREFGFLESCHEFGHVRCCGVKISVSTSADGRAGEANNDGAVPEIAQEERSTKHPPQERLEAQESSPSVQSALAPEPLPVSISNVKRNRIKHYGPHRVRVPLPDQHSTTETQSLNLKESIDKNENKNENETSSPTLIEPQESLLENLQVSSSPSPRDETETEIESVNDTKEKSRIVSSGPRNNINQYAIKRPPLTFLKGSTTSRSIPTPKPKLLSEPFPTFAPDSSALSSPSPNDPQSIQLPKTSKEAIVRAKFTSRNVIPTKAPTAPATAVDLTTRKSFVDLKKSTFSVAIKTRGNDDNLNETPSTVRPFKNLGLASLRRPTTTTTTTEKTTTKTTTGRTVKRRTTTTHVPIVLKKSLFTKTFQPSTDSPPVVTKPNKIVTVSPLDRLKNRYSKKTLDVDEAQSEISQTPSRSQSPGSSNSNSSSKDSGSGFLFPRRNLLLKNRRRQNVTTESIVETTELPALELEENPAEKASSESPVVLKNMLRVDANKRRTQIKSRLRPTTTSTSTTTTTTTTTTTAEPSSSTSTSTATPCIQSLNLNAQEEEDESEKKNYEETLVSSETTEEDTIYFDFPRIRPKEEPTAIVTSKPTRTLTPYKRIHLKSKPIVKSQDENEGKEEEEVQDKENGKEVEEEQETVPEPEKDNEEESLKTTSERTNKNSRRNSNRRKTPSRILHKTTTEETETDINLDQDEVTDESEMEMSWDNQNESESEPTKPKSTGKPHRGYDLVIDRNTRKNRNSKTTPKPHDENSENTDLGQSQDNYSQEENAPIPNFSDPPRIKSRPRYTTYTRKPYSLPKIDKGDKDRERETENEPLKDTLKSTSDLPVTDITSSADDENDSWSARETTTHSYRRRNRIRSQTTTTTPPTTTTKLTTEKITTTTEESLFKPEEEQVQVTAIRYSFNKPQPAPRSPPRMRPWSLASSSKDSQELKTNEDILNPPTIEEPFVKEFQSLTHQFNPLSEVTTTTTEESLKVFPRRYSSRPRPTSTTTPKSTFVFPPFKSAKRRSEPEQSSTSFQNGNENLTTKPIISPLRVTTDSVEQIETQKIAIKDLLAKEIESEATTISSVRNSDGWIGIRKNTDGVENTGKDQGESIIKNDKETLSFPPHESQRIIFSSNSERRTKPFGYFDSTTSDFPPPVPDYTSNPASSDSINNRNKENPIIPTNYSIQTTSPPEPIFNFHYGPPKPTVTEKSAMASIIHLVQPQPSPTPSVPPTISPTPPSFPNKQTHIIHSQPFATTNQDQDEIQIPIQTHLSFDSGVNKMAAGNSMVQSGNAQDYSFSPDQTGEANNKRMPSSQMMSSFDVISESQEHMYKNPSDPKLPHSTSTLALGKGSQSQGETEVREISQSQDHLTSYYKKQTPNGESLGQSPQSLFNSPSLVHPNLDILSGHRNRDQEKHETVAQDNGHYGKKLLTSSSASLNTGHAQKEGMQLANSERPLIRQSAQQYQHKLSDNSDNTPSMTRPHTLPAIQTHSSPASSSSSSLNSQPSSVQLNNSGSKDQYRRPQSQKQSFQTSSAPHSKKNTREEGRKGPQSLPMSTLKSPSASASSSIHGENDFSSSSYKPVEPKLAHSRTQYKSQPVKSVVHAEPFQFQSEISDNHDHKQVFQGQLQNPEYSNPPASFDSNIKPEFSTNRKPLPLSSSSSSLSSSKDHQQSGLEYNPHQQSRKQQLSPTTFSESHPSPSIAFQDKPIDNASSQDLNVRSPASGSRQSTKQKHRHNQRHNQQYSQENKSHSSLDKDNTRLRSPSSMNRGEISSRNNTRPSLQHQQQQQQQQNSYYSLQQQKPEQQIMEHPSRSRDRENIYFSSNSNPPRQRQNYQTQEQGQSYYSHILQSNSPHLISGSEQQQEQQQPWQQQQQLTSIPKSIVERLKHSI